MKDTRAKAAYFTAVSPQMREKDIKHKTVVGSEPPNYALDVPVAKVTCTISVRIVVWSRVQQRPAQL